MKSSRSILATLALGLGLLVASCHENPTGPNLNDDLPDPGYGTNATAGGGFDPVPGLDVTVTSPTAGAVVHIGGKATIEGNLVGKFDKGSSMKYYVIMYGKVGNTIPWQDTFADGVPTHKKNVRLRVTLPSIDPWGNKVIPAVGRVTMCFRGLKKGTEVTVCNGGPEFQVVQ